MSELMRAARLHAVGEKMVIEHIERPRATGTDVVVAVTGCGMVPNLANVLANWENWYPQMPLPPRPAIFGLDPVGVVHEVGDSVVNVKPGDRVYVNPKSWPLDEINEAISSAASGDGGFTSYLVDIVGGDGPAPWAHES